MALPAGTRLGPYEIVALLGAGGMGEVYHARDTRLERSVAINYMFMAVSARILDTTGFPIRVGSLDSPETVEVTRSMANPLLASGYLLFRRDTALVAQPFDVRTLRLSGSPVQVAEESAFNPITNQGLFSASRDGVLAYQRAASGSQMIWFDREGRRLEAATLPGNYNTLCLTSDETRIVYEQAEPGSGSIDIWALERGSAAPSRLTFEPSIDFYPVCAPSGPEVVFASLREGPPNLYRQNITAPGSEKAVLRSFLPKIASDWSRDGKLLVAARWPRAVLYRPRPEADWRRGADRQRLRTGRRSGDHRDAHHVMGSKRFGIAVCGDRGR